MDVFLGRVMEQSGAGLYPSSNPDRSSDLPYTLYRVEVLKSLKGKLSGVIEVTQPGGINNDGNADLLEDDPMLASGEICLFITYGAYDPAAGPDELQMLAGRPTLVNRYGDIRVRSETEKTQVLDKYRVAVAQQVKPEL